MKITISGTGFVIADEAFTSVIDNIIGNAQMHSGSNNVDVEIKEDGKFVSINISDKGKGIPDEIKGKLFTEGFKYGETGHTGLGLYIVKMTIERFGGGISVENNKPKGSVFLLQLPKAG